MNSVMDVPTFQIRTPAYSGIERRQIIRPVPVPKGRPAAKRAPDRDHPRRVAVEFAGLLAAGILCGRLCMMLERPGHVAATRPSGNFLATVYQWSGFHRVSYR